MNDSELFFCAGCGVRLPESGLGNYPINCEGYYGVYYCYDCSAEALLQHMSAFGHADLYFIFIEQPNVARGYGRLLVTNTRGDVQFLVEDWKESRRRDFTYRIDFWFTFDGSVWHGYSYGSGIGAQECRVKRTKRKSLPDKSFRNGKE